MDWVCCMNDMVFSFDLLDFMSTTVVFCDKECLATPKELLVREIDTKMGSILCSGGIESWAFRIFSFSIREHISPFKWKKGAYFFSTSIVILVGNWTRKEHFSWVSWDCLRHSAIDSFHLVPTSIMRLFTLSFQSADCSHFPFSWIYEIIEAEAYKDYLHIFRDID